jgi:hypothetical protein
MSDSETIIQLLRNVEQRSRSNRLRHELALGLSTVLTPLVALEVWALFAPLTARAIGPLVAIYALSIAGYVVWRLLKRGTLDEAAASIDLKAGLHDEIKTAFWFINNPRSSEWVDRQIQRAAKHAGDIDLDRAYPRTIPRTSFVAGAMVLLFVGLNFFPQSTPLFGLTERERATAETAATPGIADQVRQSINRGLEEIARALGQSEPLKALAQALMEKQLARAAEEMRNLLNQLGNGTSAAAQEMLQGFRNASTNPRSGSGLEALGQKLNELAEAIESEDEAAIQEAVEKAAEGLESLEGDMLARVDDSADGAQNALEIQAPPSPNPQQMQKAGNSQVQSSNSMGRGGSGRGQAEGAPQGTPTALAVKLEQERLKSIENDATVAPTDEEEASKQERSTLEYRDVKSELSAARKEVLTRHTIPWEYRSLIKSYFQAIQGPAKKP